MPLLLITGLPCSGKTHRAQQIFEDFQSRISALSATPQRHVPENVTIQLLASHHAHLDPPHPSAQDLRPTDPPTNPRDVIYNTAREEKTARAEEFSAIKRVLNKNTVVIADAPNYIKGFRYQMWCEAKAVGTRSVVVHSAAREDECKSWNEERIRAWGWDELLKDTPQTHEGASGPKIGKDVQGELQPESHTAIFGDRLVDGIPESGLRSRSSSMGGVSDSEAADRKRDVSDAMTLKSLYISKDGNNTTSNGEPMNSDHLPNPSYTNTSNGISQERPETVATSALPAPRSSLPYTPTSLQFLSMRYEPPSPFTRWDTPLLTVPSTDAHPPYQAIWDAIFPPPVKKTKKTTSQLRPGDSLNTKPEEVRRHAATVLPKATGAEALQTLESATADVVKILLNTARNQGAADGEGGKVIFTVDDPKAGNEIQINVEIPLNTMLSQPALQRLRRKYTQIQRGGIAHGQGHVGGRSEIVRDFSKFLETEWNAE